MRSLLKITTPDLDIEDIEQMATKEMPPAVSRVVNAEEFVRFNLSQRAEHLLMLLSFTILSVTGIPQKFHEAGWAISMISAMGGIELVRNVHHFFAVVLVLECVYHVVVMIANLAKGRLQFSMIPTPKDLFDVIHTLQYFFGLREEEPKFGRFDFRQKFEYWGLVWGTVVMIITGAIMWFPVAATGILPGALIPAAKAAHGGEAVLAVLTIVTWHFYSAHLGPKVFPGDTSIFTGKIDRERMLEEHPLEFVQLVKNAQKEAEKEKVLD